MQHSEQQPTSVQQEAMPNRPGEGQSQLVSQPRTAPAVEETCSSEAKDVEGLRSAIGLQERGQGKARQTGSAQEALGSSTCGLVDR